MRLASPFVKDPNDLSGVRRAAIVPWTVREMDANADAAHR
jgi:hypothetical protein